MNAKDYLRNFRHRAIKIELLTEEIDRLNTLAEGTSIGYSEKIKTSQTDTSEVLTKLVDKKDELLREKLEYMEEYEYVDKLTREIGSVELECVIRLRYFNGYKWEDIANRMKYSIRWIHHLHGKALSKIQNNIDRKNESVHTTSH